MSLFCILYRLLGVAAGSGDISLVRVERDQLITSESKCTVFAVQASAVVQEAFIRAVMTSTMSRPDLHHGPPLQLDFSTIAPRITTGTATPIKQKVHRLRAGRTSHYSSHATTVTSHH